MKSDQANSKLFCSAGGPVHTY